jgi:3'(2'), 5'-bisphosphate nucleotidase
LIGRGISVVYETEARDAARIAREAGSYLLRLRDRLARGEFDAAEARHLGDQGSNELILRLLAQLYPEDAVLSEESKDNLDRVRRRRVWIVDPLDGTREFGELDRADWAVHVALAVDGAPVAAAVALPGRGLVLDTHPAPTPAPRQPGPLRLLVSRTRPPALAVALADRLEGELVPMGSAGAKTMAVLLGEGDVYVHAGGQYEWDSAAPVGVAHAAGLHVSRIDGSPLVYNQPNPWLPDQLVCRPELAQTVLEALRGLHSA